MFKLEQNGKVTEHETFVEALEYAFEHGRYNDGVMCGYLGHTITEI